MAIRNHPRKGMPAKTVKTARRADAMDTEDGYRWRRKKVEYTFPGVSTTKISGIPLIKTDWPNTFVGGSDCWDMSHGRAHRYLGLNPNGVTVADIGSNLFIEHRKVSVAPSSVMSFRRVQNGTVYTYNGYVLPTVPTAMSTFPALGPVSNFELSSFGQTARSRVDPTNPAADVSVLMGELFKEGLPSLSGASTLRDTTSTYRASGSEYLNVEFGWKPLVSEVRSIAQAVVDANKIIRQAHANKGKPVRREYRFPPMVKEPVKTRIAQGARPWPTASLTQAGAVSGDAYRTKTESWDVWFSGCFTYFMGPDESQTRLARYEAEAQRLLGARLTPDALWNLAPWTWMLDWHVDFGAMLSNLRAMILDGSVMWYGYCMSHRWIDEVYTHTAYPQLETTVTREIKQRARAFPFGFGLEPDWSHYDNRQLAILAALGLTKM